MLDLLFKILSIYSLAFFIRESYLLDKPRDFLMKRSVFFFKLLQCWHCICTHTGYIVYLVMTPTDQYSWRGFVLYAMAGGAIGLFLNGVMNKLYEQK